MTLIEDNAFKGLKRNHALLNRKSRGKFDIYEKNKDKRKPAEEVEIASISEEQRAAIREKALSEQRAENRFRIVKIVLALGGTVGLYYLGLWLYNVWYHTFH